MTAPQGPYSITVSHGTVHFVVRPARWRARILAIPQPALYAHTRGIQAAEVLTVDDRAYTAAAHYYYDGADLWPFTCEGRTFRRLDSGKEERTGTVTWNLLDRVITDAVRTFTNTHPQWWSDSLQMGHELALGAADTAIEQARRDRDAVDSRWQQWTNANPR